MHKLGIVLHDAGNTPFAEPLTIDQQSLVKANEVTYKAGLNKVQEFLADADLYRIRQQNKMAAFMLHQAAEHALHTLLRISTGLYVNTHNIDKAYPVLFDGMS
ncbi:MAG: HEPN domain-containing protein [Segetibacter sp.]